MIQNFYDNLLKIFYIILTLGIRLFLLDMDVGKVLVDEFIILPVGFLARQLILDSSSVLFLSLCCCGSYSCACIVYCSMFFILPFGN